MSKELIDRLRQSCCHDSFSVDGCASCEAADTIERLERERDELLTRMSVVCEAPIISAAYDRVRKDHRFAADDFEYDLFAAGWKEAIASVKEWK